MKKRLSFQAWFAVATVLFAFIGKPGAQDYRDSATGMEFVYVKGRCYQMGDTFGDGGSDEKPVHEVCVNSFYMGKYEVTQGQWKAVVGNNPSIFSSCGDNCPVERVSWDDIQEFLKKLNDKTGKKFRLPYEAEWEYAAKSGGKMEKWAGTNDMGELKEYAWFEDNSAKKTHAVGKKRPNGLGIYDMSGNVWEWVEDKYGDKYYAESPKDNPKGPMSSQYRVLRGGSWSNAPSHIRVANRGMHVSSHRSNAGSGGLRLSLSAGQ